MSTSDPNDSSVQPYPTVAVSPWRPGALVVPAAIVLAIVAVLVLGQALFHHASAQNNRIALTDAPRGVTVVVARAARFRPTHRYVGTLEPWVEARVGPQFVAAYVSTVLVRPGATVHRGDVLATLDCREAAATTQAVSLQARALEARQVALESQATRMTGLLDGGFVAANEVDQRRAESESEQARLLATRAQLLGSSLAVRDCILRAPFDGEVGDRLVDPGAFVRPGSPVISLVDRTVVRVTADVPETDFATVAPGTAVRMKLLATGREIVGAVARRSPSADPSTRTVHIEIDLADSNREVPVNTTAEITVEVGEPRAAVEIPLVAANVRGTHANVFTVDGPVVHARTLGVLGEREGDLFVDPSIAAGTQVVTEGRALLADGDRVTARTAEPVPAPVPAPAVPTQAHPEGAR